MNCSEESKRIVNKIGGELIPAATFRGPSGNSRHEVILTSRFRYLIVSSYSEREESIGAMISYPGYILIVRAGYI